NPKASNRDGNSHRDPGCRPHSDWEVRGALRDVHPAELGAVAARAAIERAELVASDVDEVIMGQARQAGSGPNPARQVGRKAGVLDRAPAETINKACASGLQAIVAGA